VDPDAALNNLRSALKQFFAGDKQAAHRVAESASALDEWMSGGISSQVMETLTSR
jgi:hypothetical protein